MPTLKQIIFVFVLVCSLLSTATAQESPSALAQRSSLTITAAAAGERVRITAPASVVQMRVEVYAASGEKLFDQEIRGGNVFDWHLQDGQAQRLAPGDYVCVVTAKSVSGKLTQKIGTVSVAEKSVSVQAAEAPKLSVLQTQAIGPVEENSSWTIAAQDEPQTGTVIANDGTDGQMIRGRGALTFRIGDFFSGNDTEQMRLTETGNLGIGTSEPKATLDVAGTIRAQRFLVAKPNQHANNALAGNSAQAPDDANSVQPLVAGTGTQNQIAKWTDNSGTLGNSGITETAGGFVGIGTASPAFQLHQKTPAGGVAFFMETIPGVDVFESMGTDPIAGPAFNFGYSGGTFGRGSGFFNARPDAGAVAPNPSLRFMTANIQRMIITNTGNVGIGTTNPGARLQVASAGDSLTSYTARFQSSPDVAGAGGILFDQNAPYGWKMHTENTGAPSDGALIFSPVEIATGNNVSSSVILSARNGGSIGIRTFPAQVLDVNGEVRIREMFIEASTASVCRNVVGDLVLCGASSRRLKTNIAQFRSGLDIVRRLRPISFDWKDGSGQDIGLGAEDVANVAPSFTFSDKKGEVVGIKYERLNMLLINAINEQQKQIEQLRAKLRRLRSTKLARGPRK